MKLGATLRVTDDQIREASRWHTIATLRAAGITGRAASRIADTLGRHRCLHDFDERCVPPACRLCGRPLRGDRSC